MPFAESLMKALTRCIACTPAPCPMENINYRAVITNPVTGPTVITIPTVAIIPPTPQLGDIAEGATPSRSELNFDNLVVREVR